MNQKSIEYVTSDKFFEIIKSDLGLSFNTKEIESFYLLLGTKILSVRVFDFEEIEMVICDIFKEKKAKINSIATIEKVKFNLISTKSKRFFNRLRVYIEN